MDCYGIQTDLLLVNALDEEKLKMHFELKNEIGGLKIEYENNSWKTD